MSIEELSTRIEALEKQADALHWKSMEAMISSLPNQVGDISQKLESLGKTEQKIGDELAYIKRYGAWLAAAVAILSAVVPSWISYRSAAETQRILSYSEDSKRLYELFYAGLKPENSVGVRAAALAGLCGAIAKSQDGDDRSRIKTAAEAAGKTLARTCEFQCEAEARKLVSQGANATTLDCGVVCDVTSCLFIGTTTNDMSCGTKEHPYEELACRSR